MTEFRTNQDIDDFVEGTEKDTLQEPWDVQQYTYLRGMFLLLGEIAKRLGGSTVTTVWTDENGRPHPIGAQHEGDEIRYQCRRHENDMGMIRLSDMERILRMLGYTYTEHLENQDTVCLSIKKRP